MEAAPTALEGLHYLLKESNLRLLHDCPTPVAVEVERYYATLGSAVWSPWGWKSMGPYQRQIRWKPGWCRSCPLLDEIVAPDAT